MKKSVKDYMGWVALAGVLSYFLFLCFYFMFTTPYFGNEGSSLVCAFKSSSLDLLHPGKFDTLPCSYDHQPLYFILLKVAAKFLPLTPVGLRIPSFLAFLASFLLLGKILLKKSSNLLLTSLLLLLFFSNLSFLTTALQIRMYSIFLLFCVLQFYFFEKVAREEGGKYSGRIFNFTNILAGLFFYASHLFSLQLYLILYLKQGKAFFKKYWCGVGLYLISFVYKLPYLYEWRVIQRATFDDPIAKRTLDDLFTEFTFPLFNEYWIFFLIFFALILFSRKIWTKPLFITNSLVVILFLFLRYYFEIKEIEGRYIIFVPMMAAIALSRSLKNRISARICTLLLLVIFLLTPFQFSRLKTIQTNLWNKRDLVFEANYLAMRDRFGPNGYCYPFWGFYEFFRHRVGYLNYERGIDLRQCPADPRDEHILISPSYMEWKMFFEGFTGKLVPIEELKDSDGKVIYTLFDAQDK